MEGPARYTIAGGRADADRLARQAHVMARATDRFLTGCGARPGSACLDVGCGDGQVTIAVARAVGARGRAVGIDSDADALEIAREGARRAGVAVEFVLADAADLPEHDAFDLVFARLLLSHLADPVAVLRAMRDAARPGGVVAAEDLDTTTLRSEPPAPALERLRDVYSATVRHYGGDPVLGPRLEALLGFVGLRDVAEQIVVNRMGDAAGKGFLAELVVTMRETILAASAATAAELDALHAGLERVADDDATVIFQACMHQVAGRRAG
jgi:ubiquinone/menaquinone biosynthesis C-methylase UbiE